MIFGKVIWSGTAAMAKAEKELQQRLDKAAIMVVNEVVSSFGNPPPEPDSKGGFKKNSSKAWKRRHHSAPGEPPFRQTSTLARSITFDRPSKFRRRVGSTLKGEGGSPHSYAYYLELGTEKMKARPYLRPAVYRLRGTILRIIVSG